LPIVSQYIGVNGSILQVFNCAKIENLDKAIADFELITRLSGGTLQPVLYMDYFTDKNHGNTVMDGRLSYEFSKKHKFSLICNNLLNRSYSLRPLKAEEIRSFMLQYVINI